LSKVYSDLKIPPRIENWEIKNAQECHTRLDQIISFYNGFAKKFLTLYQSHYADGLDNDFKRLQMYPSNYDQQFVESQYRYMGQGDVHYRDIDVAQGLATLKKQRLILNGTEEISVCEYMSRLKIGPLLRIPESGPRPREGGSGGSGGGGK
ncbi:MAG: hypothetical protein WCG27_11560, partial [Pseudomonadota bacterium]